MSISAVQPNFGATQTAASSKGNKTSVHQQANQETNYTNYALGLAGLAAIAIGGYMYATRGKAPSAEVLEKQGNPLLEGANTLVENLRAAAPKPEAVKEARQKALEKGKEVNKAINENSGIKAAKTEYKTAHKELSRFETLRSTAKSTKEELTAAVEKSENEEIKNAYKAVNDAQTAVEGKTGDELIQAQDVLAKAQETFAGKVAGNKDIEPAFVKSFEADDSLIKALNGKSVDEKLKELTDNATSKKEAFDKAVAGDETISKLIKERDELLPKYIENKKAISNLHTAESSLEEIKAGFEKINSVSKNTAKEN